MAAGPGESFSPDAAIQEVMFISLRATAIEMA